MKTDGFNTVTTRLTARQCAQAESAFHRLRGHDLTLTKAVDLALAGWKQTTAPIV